jgi:hypothetical protein
MEEMGTRNHGFKARNTSKIQTIKRVVETLRWKGKKFRWPKTPLNKGFIFGVLQNFPP